MEPLIDVWGVVWRRVGRSGKRPGDFFAYLSGFLEHLFSFIAVSKRVGCVLEAFWKRCQSILEASWGVVGAFWGGLRSSWGAWGASLVRLGASRRHLDRILTAQQG